MLATARDNPRNNHLCTQCHGQLLAALEARDWTQEEDMKEGFWEVSVCTLTCSDCTSLFRLPKTWKTRVTSREMADLGVAATTAFHVGGPSKAGQSNLALASQRMVPPADRLAGPLTSARLEVLPILMAMLGSANKQPMGPWQSLPGLIASSATLLVSRKTSMGWLSSSASGLRTIAELSSGCLRPTWRGAPQVYELTPKLIVRLRPTFTRMTCIPWIALGQELARVSFSVGVVTLIGASTYLTSRAIARRALSYTILSRKWYSRAELTTTSASWTDSSSADAAPGASITITSQQTILSVACSAARVAGFVLAQHWAYLRLRTSTAFWIRCAGWLTAFTGSPRVDIWLVRPNESHDPSRHFPSAERTRMLAGCPGPSYRRCLNGDVFGHSCSITRCTGQCGQPTTGHGIDSPPARSGIRITLLEETRTASRMTCLSSNNPAATTCGTSTPASKTAGPPTPTTSTTTTATDASTGKRTTASGSELTAAQRLAEVQRLVDNYRLEAEAVTQRSTEVGGATLVMATDFRTGETADNPVGVLVCPTVEPRVVYGPTRSNVCAAIEERIEIPNTNVKYALSEQERSELRSLPLEMCKDTRGVFTRRKILWVAEVLLGEDICSGRWSAKRFENAVTQLCQRYEPMFRFKVSLKLEPMKVGKAPRMLISDEDAGQVMALMTIAIIERIITDTYPDQTIKGVSKIDAMNRVCRHLTRDFNDRPYGILENDGKYWDGHCGLPLRSDTENVIVDHVAAVLREVFIPIHSWSQAHDQAGHAKRLTLRFCVTRSGNDGTIDDMFHFKKNIASVRRSGHRGTSVLNWLINFICWGWVLGGPKCQRFADRNCRGFTNGGKQYTVDKVFEGDDSSLGIGGLDETLVDSCRVKWERLGHEPKLIWRREGEVAEFTGCKFQVSAIGLTGIWAPDCRRQLANGPLSVSKDLVDAAVRGKAKETADLASGCLLGLAAGYVTSLPSVGRYFLSRAREWNPKLEEAKLSADALAKMGLNAKDMCVEWWKSNQNDRLLAPLEKESSLKGVIQALESPQVHLLNNEAETAVSLGFVDNTLAWGALVEKLASTSNLTSLDEFRRATAPFWRN